MERCCTSYSCNYNIRCMPTLFTSPERACRVMYCSDITIIFTLYLRENQEVTMNFQGEDCTGALQQGLRRTPPTNRPQCGAVQSFLLHLKGSLTVSCQRWLLVSANNHSTRHAIQSRVEQVCADQTSSLTKQGYRVENCCLEIMSIKCYRH